ncbi:MAG TPA: hypothetical protein VGN55_03940 [Xanthobacteraceae bacterium]|jgi:hypothetical protein
MDRLLVIAALLGLLGLALWAAYRQWTLFDVDVPAWAWVSMGFGALLSILVDGGLMALIFYSSRKGYDEPPHKIDPPDEQ